jgi:hypothetical protein
MAFISYLQPFLDVNKRTKRLACNIALFKNRLAPLSFLEMDKEKYVEGVLAFYELNRIDLLKSAYIQGYVDSASRYDAYVGREQSAVELGPAPRRHPHLREVLRREVREPGPPCRRRSICSRIFPHRVEGPAIEAGRASRRNY